MKFFKSKPLAGPYEVFWEPEAEELVKRDGNYVLKLVREEFDSDPDRERVEIDGTHFLTPVVKRRYSVIWKRQEATGKPIATVEAVVPLRFAQEATGGLSLKERVKKSVLQESDGRVVLDF